MLTGRENVYVNGAMLGIPVKHIPRPTLQRKTANFLLRVAKAWVITKGALIVILNCWMPARSTTGNFRHRQLSTDATKKFVYIG